MKILAPFCCIRSEYIVLELNFFLTGEWKYTGYTADRKKFFDFVCTVRLNFALDSSGLFELFYLL